MNDYQAFYRSFEEKHRGSRELIKSRLEVYFPFVKPLANAYPSSRVLDLGCGRGEWLEHARNLGFDAVGADLDDGMLEASRTLGLQVENADAIAFLKSQPESSAAVISGFHIAEHIPFPALQEMVEQALRVLFPGGLLILETPNPENLTVGACNFYLDPTHERPLPPELLSFLPEFYGFLRTKILRLQEPVDVKEGNSLQLLDLFSSVSPDYAVIAQKAGDEQVTGSLDEAYRLNYGVDLPELAVRYERQVKEMLAEAASVAEQALARAEQAQAKADQAKAEAKSKDKTTNFEARLEHIEAFNRQLAERATLAEAELTKTYQSRSWRLTYPMRWVVFQGRLLREHGAKARWKAAVRKAIFPLLGLVITTIGARPGLRRRLRTAAGKVGLYQSLNRIYQKSRNLQHAHTPYDRDIWYRQHGSIPESPRQLTPRARRIYRDLQSAMEQKKRE
jgi:SAM-dependent methyltransferase